MRNVVEEKRYERAMGVGAQAPRRQKFAHSKTNPAGWPCEDYPECNV